MVAECPGRPNPLYMIAMNPNCPQRRGVVNCIRECIILEYAFENLGHMNSTYRSSFLLFL